jgi:hypothetical protein
VVQLSTPAALSCAYSGRQVGFKLSVALSGGLTIAAELVAPKHRKWTASIFLSEKRNRC